LSKPLGRNGFTAKSLGKARPPLRGAFSPPCTSLISLMIEGAVASLPVWGSLCTSPRGPHRNGLFVPGLPGVPKLRQPGLPRL
jgi:hypothetical protein